MLRKAHLRQIGEGAAMTSNGAPFSQLTPKVPKVPKASSVLANEIRRRILVERRPVGSELPNEAQLIEESGFSRATVREALRLLEDDGLISIKRGAQGGIKVARPDASPVSRSMAMMLALSDTPMRHLFAYRLILEPAAAAIAAVAANDEQRDRLLALATPSPADPVIHNVNFHLVLAEATDNEFFKVSLHAMHELNEWHSHNEGLSSTELSATVTAHARIAEHISKGNAVGAERAMRRHIEVFQEVMEAHGRLDAPVMRDPRVASWL
jgi:GntR family transcriptional regulator, transcriptional repressor for pyruvate dehydrogenase complex